MNKLDNKIFCFIKFGPEEHLLNLRDYGELYFNVPKNFNNYINLQRGDLYEGSEWILNTEFSKIEVEHPSIGRFKIIPNKGDLGRLIQYNYTYLSYSLYTISTYTFAESLQHQIDDSLLQFGDSALLIKEPYKFLNKISRYFIQHGIQYEMNFVKYIDFTKKGKINTNPFNKKLDHSHQMEFRIIIKNLNNAPEKMRVGGIHDYSSLLESKSIIEMKWLAQKK